LDFLEEFNFLKKISKKSNKYSFLQTEIVPFYKPKYSISQNGRIYILYEADLRVIGLKFPGSPGTPFYLAYQYYPQWRI